MRGVHQFLGRLALHGQAEAEAGSERRHPLTNPPRVDGPTPGGDFFWLAATPIAPRKQADQPAANSRFRLVAPLAPGRATQPRAPVEFCDAPSRPPAVWFWPYTALFRCSWRLFFPTSAFPCVGRRNLYLQGNTGAWSHLYNRTWVNSITSTNGR